MNIRDIESGIKWDKENLRQKKRQIQKGHEREIKLIKRDTQKEKESNKVKEKYTDNA